MNNLFILAGWILRFLKLMIIYWYISVPAILILVLAVYLEHRIKHKTM